MKQGWKEEEGRGGEAREREKWKELEGSCPTKRHSILGERRRAFVLCCVYVCWLDKAFYEEEIDFAHE